MCHLVGSVKTSKKKKSERSNKKCCACGKMAVPSELSLAEIRNFMLKNGGKVTNHELVKYFKQFLTHPNTKGEARKRFKTYVNILSTIKNENNEKYLILRKRYYNECPVEFEPDDDLNLFGNPELLQSPGSRSGISFSEHDLGAGGRLLNELQSKSPEPSPYKEPPPYKPPPKVMMHAYQNQEKYGECVDEFRSALYAIGCQQGKYDDNTDCGLPLAEPTDTAPKLPPKLKSSKDDANYIKQQMQEQTSMKSNVPLPPPLPSNRSMSEPSEDKENVSELPSKPLADFDIGRTLDKQISVKEATKKFNKIASEEEASKIISPTAKKRPEKQIDEVASENLVSLSGHPKSKEWLVSAARSNYQELAKLSAEHPELVRLQDPTTGYTALHWAAKHGNEDVVKLIAGTHKADVNAKTNGGYSPLHLAVQFGKDNIFELLCNVYKANRDVLDWSGRKPLDYRKPSTSVSALTYSSKYGNDKCFNNYSTTTALPIGTTDAYVDGFSNTLKIKRNKRFSTMNGVIRSHSMKGFIKTTLPVDTLTLPKRTTHFSPELNHDKRNQKTYRSIFRKKSIGPNKTELNNK